MQRQRLTNRGEQKDPARPGNSDGARSKPPVLVILGLLMLIAVIGVLSQASLQTTQAVLEEADGESLSVDGALPDDMALHADGLPADSTLLADVVDQVDQPLARTPGIDAAEGQLYISAELESHRQPAGCPAGDHSDSMLTTEAATNALFERIASLTQFQPKVLSRDPWIVSLDAFLTREECDEFIKACDYWSSDALAGGATNLQYRNSSSFACDPKDSCFMRPAISRYAARLHKDIGVDLHHSEGVSVLKYDVGGFYGKHHDYLYEDVDPTCWRSSGPRVMTVMAYLTDVAQGGATSFFHLGLDVVPTAGKLVVWLDTFANDPLQKDERTAHEALKVIEGVKITATSWIAQYDRIASATAGCCR